MIEKSVSETSPYEAAYYLRKTKQDYIRWLPHVIWDRKLIISDIVSIPDSKVHGANMGPI